MDTEKENAQQREQDREQLTELGAATTKTSKGTIYTLTIIGQIEGHQVLPETVKSTKYEHVMPLLASIEESEDIDGLLLLLNTVGGDIAAGLAIAELISGMKKRTVSLVLRSEFPGLWSARRRPFNILTEFRSGLWNLSQQILKLSGMFS